MNSIKQIAHKNCEINIYYDDDPFNPREDFDHFGKMICWHNRYSLGDSHDFASPEDFRETLAENDLILTLYLYDHSGISMSCSSWYGRAQHADWDSGPVGYIYATAEDIRKEYGVKRISKKLREKVAGYLESEVKEYDYYLRGEVYGYNVEHNESGEEDSCWGFIGDTEYIITEAKSVAEWMDNDHCETLTKQAEQSRITKQMKVKQLLHAHVPLEQRAAIINQLS